MISQQNAMTNAIPLVKIALEIPAEKNKKNAKILARFLISL